MKPSKRYFLANCDRYAINRALSDLDRQRGEFVAIALASDGRETVKTMKLKDAKR